jgi:alkanesulfonate monooxygenase SsuD/methylene tetrahydromethanopterin reductase-like flavin-dependent oxidoreductase (luciferase family)
MRAIPDLSQGKKLKSITLNVACYRGRTGGDTMKVDAVLGSDAELGDVPGAVRRLEEAGYDGAWCAEVSHDPFLPLAVAAVATSRIELGTSIAVAFARSPMTMAYTANDLQAAARGRFILGLGSQI